MRVWEWEHESWLEEEDGDLMDSKDGTPPELVDLAPRLTIEGEALEKITSSEDPVVVKYRVQSALSAFCLMGDASRK